MPELPDIAAYISALEPRIIGQPLERVRLASAFLLRTAQPPLVSVEGRMVRDLRRIGKRIAIGVENDLWRVLLGLCSSNLSICSQSGSQSNRPCDGILSAQLH
jgi:formamidopyrimidine-DNA glycosylase